MKDLPVYPISKGDPLKRYVNKEVEDYPSPMDPPPLYTPPTIQVPYDQMVQTLKNLIDDHNEFEKVLNVFDKALISFKEKGWQFDPEISTAFKKFFQYMDDDLVHHTRKEEKALFPFLQEKLLESGEHSPGPHPMTPVDLMEADHARVAVMTNLVFNLLGLAARIRDDEARNLLFDHSFHQGQEVVEVMRLHVYKENTTVFPLAQQLLNEKDWENVVKKMEHL